LTDGAAGVLAFLRALIIWHLLGVALHVLRDDVSLYLILPEPKWKIQLEGSVVIVTRLRLLKARLVRVGRRTRAALRCASRVLRAIVIRGTICGGSGRGGEERCLSACLV
jgi:hypothetical protein